MSYVVLGDSRGDRALEILRRIIEAENNDEAFAALDAAADLLELTGPGDRDED